MKTRKDYTLNGKLTATTWQEFRKAMKEAGIETGTKTYDQLVQEYNKLNNKKPVIIDQAHGDYIVKNIVKASLAASKGDSKDKRILTMRKLFGIIKQSYVGPKGRLDERFIKEVVNELVSKQYIIYKRYESGAIIFYPTTKAAEYVANNK